MIKELVIRKN